MLEFNFVPFPVVHTERIRLRQLTIEDAPAYFEIRSNGRVMQHLARPTAQSEGDARAIIQRAEEMVRSQEGIVWAISLPDEPRMIGTIGYYRSQPQNHRSEIGYELHPDYWGQGIMSEAMRAALDYGFNQMQLHSIEADTDPANVRSARILERHGFVKEAHFRENLLFEGRFLDSAVYSLLKSDYLSQSQSSGA